LRAVSRDYSFSPSSFLAAPENLPDEIASLQWNASRSGLF